MLRRPFTVIACSSLLVAGASCGSSTTKAAVSTTAASMTTATGGPVAGPPAPSTTAKPLARPCVTRQPAGASKEAFSTPAGLAPIDPADISPAGSLSDEPTVYVPSGSPPASLEGADLIEGTGLAVTPGDTVKVQYVGCSWTNKALFDASWSDNGPITFSLGQVIKGWAQGLIGMKVGGRRELIIPPSLGYGSQGSPPKIPPNDTLVFVVDLLGIV
jgi:peptidylprolyl isomerase